MAVGTILWMSEALEKMRREKVRARRELEENLEREMQQLRREHVTTAGAQDICGQIAGHLEAPNIRGRVAKATAIRIRTRARAKAAPESTSRSPKEANL